MEAWIEGQESDGCWDREKWVSDGREGPRKDEDEKKWKIKWQPLYNNGSKSGGMTNRAKKI